MRFFTHDLPQALWRLRRAPGFTFAAAGVFALGLGATTMVFAVVYGVLFRPLPYPEPHELVAVYESNPPKGFDTFSASPPNFVDWRAQAKTLDGLAAYSTGSVTWTGGELSGGQTAERVSGVWATEDLLPMLGAVPVAGRVFGSADFASETPTTALLTESFWRRRFGADPGAVGRTLTINGKPLTVVGVLPETIRYPSTKAELFVPWKFSADEMENRGAKWLGVVGRRRDGVDLEAVRADLKSLAARLEAAYPDKNAGWTVVVDSLADDLVGSSRRGLFVILGAVGILFAIVCANASSLLVVRAQLGADSAAVRRALGATSAVLVREKLAETLALALVGGGAGFLLARAGLSLFLAAGGAELPRQADIRLDATVALFAIVATLAAVAIAAVAPALLVVGSANAANLHGAASSTRSAPRRARVRATLVAGEVALTLVLLLGAGLLFRSLANLAAVDTGFTERNALTFRLRLAGDKYEQPEARGALYRELSSSLAALPGVSAAGGVNVLPLSGNDWSLSFRVVGRPEPSPGEESSAEYRVATPGYFDAIGMSILRGRGLTEQDAAGTELVALVSQTFVRRHFPNEEPLGKELVIGDRTPTPRRIVGVVADVRQFDLARDAVPELYIPAAQKPPGGMSFVLRAGAGTSSPTLAPAVRELVARLDRDLPVYELMTVGDYVSNALARPLLWTRLLGLFSALALLLAAVGLYGVIAFSVAARRRELGIRAALGAERRRLLALVLGEGMRLGGLGVAAGVILAVPAAKAIASQLYGVAPTDPLALGATCALLLVVCLAASLGPARRATAVDPAETLRSE
jgi:putative ABC transport system permease protein